MKRNMFPWLLLNMILISACTAQAAVPSPIPATPPDITTPTVVPITLTPSLTPTPVPTVTRTPLPTLSSEDREKLLAELLQTNSNCSKPCIWGISPGISNFDDAVAFLKSLGRKGLEGIKDNTHYFNVTYNYKNENDTIINVVLLAKSESVDGIGASLDGLQNKDVSSLDWLAFRPDSVIKTYGVPSSVKIAVSEGPDGWMDYQLLIIYDAINLSILYTPTDHAIFPTPFLHTCPLATHGIKDLEIWLGQVPDHIPPKMQDIGEVTPLTVEDFSKLLIDKKENGCFDIPLSH